MRSPKLPGIDIDWNQSWEIALLAFTPQSEHLCGLAEICRADYVGSPENLGTTSLRKQYNFSGRSVKVPVRTLDEYCATQGITSVSAIKLDVEGAELLVLRGAERVLASRPTLIVEFEESNQRRFAFSCDDLQRFLTMRGYELYTIGAKGATAPYTADDARSMPSLNVLARPR